MLVAIDSETHRFRPGMMAPPIVCLSWATDEDKGLMLRSDVARFLGPLLEADVVIAGHRMSYDTGCLLASTPEIAPALWRAYDAGRIQCTRIRERLLDIADGSLGLEDDEEGWSKKEYSLDKLSAKLGFKLIKDETRLSYDRLDGIPLDQWSDRERSYAIDDAAACFAIFRAQDERARKMSYSAFTVEAARQARYDLALRLTSCWGLSVDQERARALDVKLSAAKHALDHKLAEAGILSPKGSVTMKIVRTLVEQSLGEEAPRTAKGAIKTGREVLEACFHPALDALAERQAIAKIKSTYVDRLIAAGSDPIHPSYEVLVSTGRTSSSGPNIQNQPRKHSVRECFKAREGWVLVSCDYDSQELRTLAQVLQSLLGRSSLAERYRSDPDYDPHVDFAADMMGIDYVEGLERKRAKDPVMKEARQRGKCCNFGLPGGMGSKKFRLYARGYGLDLTEREAAELRERWFTKLPEMRDYFAHVQAVTRSGAGTIEQIFSGRLRGMCGFSDGANSYFQGLAADASKTALYETARRCYGDPTSPLYGSRPAAFVHDEILLEAPEDRAHEAAEELARVMCEAMDVWTPDVPTRASPALMRWWSKSAEEARDAEGRLIPWEDKAA